MAKLVFNADEVKRVVEHALNSKEWSPKVVDYDKAFKAITKPGKPSVILVHDQGVYLMSNGTPRDLLDPTQKDEIGSSSYVAYAKGCHPQKDADWWDTARDLVGGDDFGETFPWAQEIKAAIDKGAKKVVIHLTTKSASLTFLYR